jgi:hypothetical protein
VLRKTAVLAGAIAFIALASSAANFSTRGAATNNDDSCDIAVTPAATLLLPYFEVDITSPANVAQTTLFSAINTSAQPQPARVTLWTDRAFPTYSFDLFLTGYEVVPVNLRDVFEGPIPYTPVSATPGPRSDSSSANPNHLPSMPGDCANRPQSIPPNVTGDLRRLFTIGSGAAGGISCANGSGIEQSVGGVHVNAIGYATIDVVATCSSLNASKPSYVSTELLFDNVLTGDYEYVDRRAKRHAVITSGCSGPSHCRSATASALSPAAAG